MPGKNKKNVKKKGNAIRVAYETALSGKKTGSKEEKKGKWGGNSTRVE